MKLSKKFDIELFLVEARAIIVESVFRSREEIIRGKWALGKLIEENIQNLSRADIYGEHINESLAIEFHCSEREIAYIRQFYRKFPGDDFERACSSLPEGKNISWTKIKKELLPASPHRDCQHQWVEVWECAKCRKIKRERHEV